METVAVYFESKVRTYGFNLTKNLLLCELTIGSEALESWGRELQSLAQLSNSFHLVWASLDGLGGIKFFLLCDDKYKDDIARSINSQRSLENNESVKFESPVELIYFHGPHFGDRHGISDFTLSALREREIPLKAMACSGATVYLVLPNDWGEKAKSVLSNAFEIPKNTKRSSNKKRTEGRP